MNTSDDNTQRRSEADAALEREIRSERKFTLTEAIGRLAGPGSMKGASPVTPAQQVVSEIETWLRQHLADSQGALITVLLQHIRESELLHNPGDQALTALSRCCRQILDSEYRLAELVRAADIEWGRAFDERPRLERPGIPPCPDDPYTLESVRGELAALLEQLPS